MEGIPKVEGTDKYGTACGSLADMTKAALRLSKNREPLAPVLYRSIRILVCHPSRACWHTFLTDGTLAGRQNSTAGEISATRR